MPVKFFPDNPIDALEKIITKEDGSPLEGEIDVYRTLFSEFKDSKDLFYIWHDVKFPVHSNSHNPYKKTEAQMDFLLVCKKGICVIEVKGGNLEFHDSEFFFRHQSELKKIQQNPLKQVNGYKYTLIERILTNFKNKLIIDLCVFPFTGVDFSIYKTIFGDSIYTRVQKTKGIKLSTFILSRFENTRNKFIEKNNNKFQEISEREMLDIKKTLSPLLTNQNSFISNKETYEWLGLKNFEVFDGLSKNQRVLIEGIPGCGKTTFALAYADQKRHLNGLYLCWNRFLKFKIENTVRQRNISNLEVKTYYLFLKELLKIDLTFEDNATIFREKVFNFFPKDNDKQYDYIIIDEGQDIINKGVEVLLEKLTHNGKGLEQGTILFLCDTEQAYTLTQDNLNEDIDALSMFFTHFQMNHAHRSVNNPHIRDLAALVLEDVYSLGNQKTSDLYSNSIFKFNSFKEAKSQMIKDFLKQIRDPSNSLKGMDCILLVESVILSDSEIQEELSIKDIEELTEHNIVDTANSLKFTTPLKYKGLEKENVALIINKPSEKNQHEIYVGITRTKQNLKIYIII